MELLAGLHPPGYKGLSMADIVVVGAKGYDRYEKIHELRHWLEEGQIQGVARISAGIRSSQTLYKWSKEVKFDRLNRLIRAAREVGQETRNGRVEDAFYGRLISGKASGSEYEFYLTNHCRDRWKKDPSLSALPGTGQPVQMKPPVVNYISVTVNNTKPEDEKSFIETSSERHSDA